MPTHTELAVQVKALYRDYANAGYHRLQFKTVPKKTLLALVTLLFWPAGFLPLVALIWIYSTSPQPVWI